MSTADDSWIVEPFDKSRHDRADFDCGVHSLNDWLITKLSQYEKRDLARAYVLVRAGENIVKGYYAIANHAVTYEALPQTQTKGLPEMDLPVVLLGRLAVDRTVQGQGFGEFLLLDALRRAEMLARTIGIQAIEVEAIDESAARFYQKFGFLPLADDPHHLLLPMKVIRNLKLPPL